jgi:hypothetical protein
MDPNRFKCRQLPFASVAVRNAEVGGSIPPPSTKLMSLNQWFSVTGAGCIPTPFLFGGCIRGAVAIGCGADEQR